MNEVERSQKSGAPVEIEAERAMREVQATVAIAKRFPRDEKECTVRILKACQRPSLAEQAMYVYPRGNTEVEGPSIRLAEAIAQAWGNMKFGFRELSREAEASVAEAFAWDMETNTWSTKVFTVPHVRDTRQGSYRVTASRDVYEVVANQAARRLRNCILELVPGDVVEQAVDQCKKTQLRMLESAPEEKLKRLVASFAEIGVDQAAIERRLRHKLEATKVGEIFELHKVYKSIQDGFQTAEEAFPPAEKRKDERGSSSGCTIFGRPKAEAKQEPESGASDTTEPDQAADEGLKLGKETDFFKDDIPE